MSQARNGFYFAWQIPFNTLKVVSEPQDGDAHLLGELGDDSTIMKYSYFPAGSSLELPKVAKGQPKSHILYVVPNPTVFFEYVVGEVNV